MYAGIVMQIKVLSLLGACFTNYYRIHNNYTKWDFTLSKGLLYIHLHWRPDPIQSTSTFTGFHLYQSYAPSLFYFCLSIQLRDLSVTDLYILCIFILLQVEIMSSTQIYNPTYFSTLSLLPFNFFSSLFTLQSSSWPLSSEFETCPFYPFHFDYTEIILVVHPVPFWNLNPMMWVLHTGSTSIIWFPLRAWTHSQRSHQDLLIHWFGLSS